MEQIATQVSFNYFEAPPELGLEAIWHRLRQQWFPHCPELDEFIVLWSSRAQKRTLASVNLSSKRVIVARELNSPKHYCWLEPLLYHEMCHAYLSSPASLSRGRRQWHGREFRKLERRHPGVILLDDWIKNGGWQKVVRSDRAQRAYRARVTNSNQGVL